MGLDVYVGPLTRYYSFTWETIVQQAAREQGIPVHVLRPPGLPSPDDAYRAVVNWREALASAAGVDVAWQESAEGEYWTDKPEWGGYFAARLLGLRLEFPELPLPKIMRVNPDHGWLLDQKLMRRCQEVYEGRKGLVRRLFGRSKVLPRPRSPHLHLAQAWVPAALNDVFSIGTPLGGQIAVGSVDALRSDLEAIASALNLDDEQLGRARRDGPAENNAFEPMSRFGLAVLLEMARTAARKRQPMILDG